MELQVALIISAILQLLAFFITISLIPRTRFSIAWISISIGFLLMALRRILEVLAFFQGATPDTISTLNSLIAIIISVAMLISSIYIRKIFEVLNRIHQLRKENEAKLLSAIISTEEKERKHFSKDLHDGLGPVLSSAKMTVSAIDKEEIEPQNAELLRKIESLIDNAIKSTREISNHLTPSALDRYGLKKAIEIFIRNTVIKETIDIKITTNFEKKRFNYNIEVILYRICCELINNTLKYANADKVDILLTESDNTIEFKYNDNGIGFDLEREENNGMGLTNIKSRVTSLNGSIDLTSTPSNGFNAHIKLPK
jgi:signal transduction histidine kinase